MSEVSLETQRRVEQFLYRQAEILDERMWDDWLNLFTPEGHYWMPASPEQISATCLPSPARSRAASTRFSSSPRA